MVNLDKSKIMHYYMMEKVLYNVFEQTKGSSQAVNVSSQIHMIITHLLNQSRNFYQIDIKIFKDNLEQHMPQAQADTSKKSNGLSSSKIPASTLSAEKLQKEETEQEEEEEEEEEQNQEDDYYDQEDYGDEGIEEEEKQINQAEDKQRTIIFNQAIKVLKAS